MINTTQMTPFSIADFETITVKIKDGTAVRIKLSRGYYVTQEFLEIVYQQAMEGIPLLEPNEPFKAEMVCGDGFWAELTDWERKLAGRAVVKLVEKEILPFSPFVKSKGCATKWYCIKE